MVDVILNVAKDFSGSGLIILGGFLIFYALISTPEVK